MQVRTTKFIALTDIKGNEKSFKNFDDLEKMLTDDSVESRLLMANIDANFKLYNEAKSDEGKEFYKKKCSTFKTKLIPIYCCDMEGSKVKSNIKSYNNYYIVDIDGIDVNKVFEILKDDVYIKFMFKSPTNGIKCIIELDITDGDYNDDIIIDFIERYVYIHISQYFMTKYNLKIDEKCKNINRACYVPSGREFFRNDDASILELWASYIKTNEYKEIVNPVVKKIGRPIVNKKSATSSILFSKSLEHLKNNGIVAFEDYNEWLKLGFILSGHNDDQTGNTLFHEFSKLSTKYNQKVVNDKWKAIVKAGYDSTKLSIKWFYFIMEKNYGFSDKENKYDAFKYTERDITWIFNNAMGYELILEDVSKRYYLKKDGKYQHLNDIELNQLLKDFRDGYMTIELKKLREYLFTKDIIKNENFIRNQLDEIRTNDPDEFNKMFSVIHCRDMVLTKKIFYRWMLGSMKNMFGEYGQYYDEILILKGEQSIGKSWFVSNGLLSIFKDYVTTSFDFRDKNKDNMKLISSYMFSIDDELSMSTRADIKVIKRITSIAHTQIRLPYAFTEENFKRIVSFIGLTNDDTVFNDDTGGRRFLICDVEKLDKELYELDWNKIWGFIYNEWMIGKDPVTDSELTHMDIMKQADSYRYKNELEEFILDNFEVDINSEMTPDEVRDIVVRNFNMTHRSISYINSQSIGSKIKTTLKIKSFVKFKSGRSVRLYNIKYIGQDSNGIFSNDYDYHLKNIIKPGKRYQS